MLKARRIAVFCNSATTIESFILNLLFKIVVRQR
jgi:hypothetical protein